MTPRQDFTPRPYQTMIIDHILSKPRAAVWAGMGTGKTVATLTALDALQMVEDGPALVIAPLRVATTTWPEEVLKWSHLRGMNVVAIVGTERERIAALKTPSQVYTTNYEQLVWLVAYWGDRWPYATVVLDESTKVKGFRLRQGGKRAQALGSIAHTRIKRLVELTGTPASNGLKDLWGQAWFVDAGARLGRTYSAFSQRWFRPDRTGFGVEPLAAAQAEIQDKLRDVCLTIEAKDWFDLHTPIINNIMVKLPVKARKHYKEMEKEMFTSLDTGDDIEAFNAAAKTQKCLQIANGAMYVGEGAQAWEEVHKAKLEALESVVEEAAGMPVLVAYNFKSDLARLQKHFPQGRHLDKKSETIKAWNAGQIPVLFAHPACLHPWTEVLTENRGWVRLIDVGVTDRVFDGVEFVTHDGCSYSGYSDVVTAFGMTMTPEHKLLVGGYWMEAKDVGNGEETKEKARYSYEGDDSYLRKMFELQHGNGHFGTEFPKTQSIKTKALPTLFARFFPLPHKHKNMAYLEGHENSVGRYIGQKLRRTWHRSMSRMERFSRVLCGHDRGLFGQSDHRTDRRERSLLKIELQVGNDVCAAGKQTHNEISDVSRHQNASGRGTSYIWRQQNETDCAVELRHDSGRSGSRRESFHLRDGTPCEKRSHVYDLINCGPRNRFVIKNNVGEVFISHNSAGHGLNLQDGGNILVFFSVNWNLEEHLQIIERIGPTRQLQSGYDRPVFIHRILARDTVDELVLQRLETKREVQDILMDAMKQHRKAGQKKMSGRSS
jgi:hypothetical protein